MKFSYSQRLGKYVASELGTIVDSDDSFDALLTRHGMLSDESEAAIATDDAITTDDAIAAAEAMADALLLEDFGVAPNSDDDDDDLAVIREFLED